MLIDDHAHTNVRPSSAEAVRLGALACLQTTAGFLLGLNISGHGYIPNVGQTMQTFASVSDADNTLKSERKTASAASSQLSGHLIARGFLHHASKGRWVKAGLPRTSSQSDC
jgi:hypothetical protein